MTVLNVTYAAQKDKLSSFLKTAKEEGLDAASRHEPGNLKYDFYFPDDGADELLLVEKWRDEEAFEQHKREPHFRRLGELKEAFGIETSMDIFSI